MRPPDVPLCSRRTGQEFSGQPEQGILHLFGQKPMTPLFEFLSELPGLRAQPQRAGLAARAEKGTPPTRLFEQLEESGTSLHTSSKASLANRLRTSSRVLS